MVAIIFQEKGVNKTIRRPKKRKSYVGETIGYLSIVEAYNYFDENGDEIREYDCFCSACGKIVRKSHRQITIAKTHFTSEGKMPSCGCLKYSGFKVHNEETVADMIGRRFCNLTVVAPGNVITTGTACKKRRTWQCKCDCGVTTYVTTGDLVSGNTKSCGCLRSTGQQRIAGLLQNMGVDFVEEYYFGDLLSERGYPLRFDFAVFSEGKLSFLLEYQGEQHYKDMGWFGKQQRDITDNQKKEYCQTHSLPLIEIAYNEDIEKRLNEILQPSHDNTVPRLGNE